jgi:hypothetical protein
VLLQPYEGGSEGAMSLSDQQEHQEEEFDSVDEEEEEASTQVETTSDQNESDRPQPAEGDYVTRSGRISKPPERLQCVVFKSVLEEYDYQDEDDWCERGLLAFKASSDTDTMHHHQA